MPELPEVEIMRRGLVKYLVGKRISKVEVLDHKIFSGNPQKVMKSDIINVRRIGKGLVIDFRTGYSLAIHVKMTGHFIFQYSHARATKHTRVIFSVGDGVLYYNDVRRFGWVRVVKTSRLEELPFFRSVGKEALIISQQEFEKMAALTKIPIKQFLMDQKRIAGIGNIYANEALFLSGILPQRPANAISKQDIEKLYGAMREVLRKSIALGGASAVNFRNIDGEKGTYQNHTMVYRREKMGCYICKGLIQRKVLGGRSAYYCAQCQK